ncbi:hypothetical protein ACFRAO_00415 [Streptomyces sp. NPDC056656]|uniref:hypothetical protein n=1 Tax=Streptomyces sp. NPDC056656 TaxID=3345895 RepID=UPI0036CA5188
MIVLGTFLFTPGIIPNYLVIQELGLIDTYAALIAPIMLNAFNIVVVRAFFQGIPDELHVAARLADLAGGNGVSRTTVDQLSAVLWRGASPTGATREPTVRRSALFTGHHGFTLEPCGRPTSGRPTGRRVGRLGARPLSEGVATVRRMPKKRKKQPPSRARRTGEVAPHEQLPSVIKLGGPRVPSRGWTFQALIDAGRESGQPLLEFTAQPPDGYSSDFVPQIDSPRAPLQAGWYLRSDLAVPVYLWVFPGSSQTRV